MRITVHGSVFAKHSRWLNEERKLNLISLPARLSSPRPVNSQCAFRFAICRSFGFPFLYSKLTSRLSNCDFFSLFHFLFIFFPLFLQERIEYWKSINVIHIEKREKY